jgi:hypothetical protein
MAYTTADYHYYTQYLRNHLNGTGDTNAEKAHIYLDRLRKYFAEQASDEDWQEPVLDGYYGCQLCGAPEHQCEHDVGIQFYEKGK